MNRKVTTISIEDYEAVVIGTSAGGLAALTRVLSELRKDYPRPILLVQHRAKDSRELFEDILQKKCQLTIRQPEEKEKILAGCVYVAPPDYHMLVETDRTIAFSVEPPVQFSRPSIDVLFQSAAIVYQDKLVGIILTGSNNDGASGIKTISTFGGLTIAQDPAEAQYSFMTQAAINTKRVEFVWDLATIARFLAGERMTL